MQLAAAQRVVKVWIYYGTLQHTAIHCWWVTATHCKARYLCSDSIYALQHTATHCHTLKRNATHCNAMLLGNCNTLQRTKLVQGWHESTATHCNTLKHTATHCYYVNARHCNTQCSCGDGMHLLQYAATHCNTLLPGKCNTLQRTIFVRQWCVSVCPK